MKLLISSSFYFFVFQLLLSPVFSQSPELLELQAYRTRAIAHIFSLIQCFPNGTDNDILGAAHTPPIPELLSGPSNPSFNPEHHLEEYANYTEINNLLDFVAKLRATGTPDNLPFTNDPTNVSNFQVILVVLWRNANNWSIFYATAAWLVGRVNSAMLFWALMIVCAEKYSETVTVPSTVEIFPQLYVPRELVLAAAGLPITNPAPIYISDNLLHYWTGDPGLNEFHTHFHQDNPYWWDGTYFGVQRYRKGELFLFMHHQMINRYNAERQSNWLPDVTPLGIDPTYVIPEGYRQDICNVDYEDFPYRPDRWTMGNFDDGPTTLATLQTMLNRLSQAIDQGFFWDSRGRPIPLNGTNGADILGATVESSNVYSANYAYYGYFHNLIHSYLSGQLRKKAEPIPGVQAHQETSMRDRVFYQIHKKVDQLYLKYKNNPQLVKCYTPADLDFPGVAIVDVKILSCPRNSPQSSWLSSIFGLNLTFPFSWQQTKTPVLTTYMTTVTYDISNAARPCRSVDDPPKPATIGILNYVPFTYVITVQSMRSTVAYGMVRIFIWPERKQDWSLLEGDEAHERAIELDRFRVRLDPGKATVITRSSLNSSLTRPGPSPGIKKLYNINPGDDLLTNPNNRRACAFPNNMLIPRGTPDGLPFKMTVYISDETNDGDVVDYPHYPFCGALKGLPFPDKRPMGFPFDRPGTSFIKNIAGTPLASLANCTQITMANVKQLPIVIKHDKQASRMFM